MFETAILVLLYNKKMAESNTLNSLKESNISYPNAKLVIWNNGPEPLGERDCTFFEDLGYDVVIEETLNNESLAIIYNKFLSDNKAEKYILLDDDSVLNESYILASSKCTKTEVGMPIIMSMGEIHYPKIDDQSYFPAIKIGSTCKVVTIGSGLTIGATIADRIKENYSQVFDERFYLYGVDSTFCFRLFESKLINKIKVIAGFNHSLSFLEKESLKITRFRRLEQSYDLGLTLRYYNPLVISVLYIFKMGIAHLKASLSTQRHTINIYHVMKAFLVGQHYRK